jgi:hypothetical protein
VTETPGLRDPDLPGLVEWGDELFEATLRAEQPRRRRTARRAIPILAVVGVFVIPGAVVATQSIWDDPVQRVVPRAPSASTPAVRLVDGQAGDVAWRVGGWNAGGGRVCLRTEAFRAGRRATAASNCAVPRTGARLTAFVVGTANLSLITGTAAAQVRSVTVRPPVGTPIKVATHAVGAENLRRSGITGAARVYVAVFPRGFGDSVRAPAVTAFGADGARLGALGGGTR